MVVDGFVWKSQTKIKKSTFVTTILLHYCVPHQFIGLSIYMEYGVWSAEGNVHYTQNTQNTWGTRGPRAGEGAHIDKNEWKKMEKSQRFVCSESGNKKLEKLSLKLRWLIIHEILFADKAIETIIDETKTCGKKVKIEYERSKKIESMRSSDQLFVKQFTIDHLPSTTEREKEKECSELRLYIDCMDL